MLDPQTDRRSGVIGGRDGPGRRALPVGEFLHPAPLAALAVLAANDWWLKGTGLLPGWVTGKLSDFAGAVFFPLLVTAVIGTVGYAARRLGADIDPSLSVGRLSAAVWGTGILLVAAKTLSPAAAALEWFLSLPGRPARIVVDPTDLLCLPALAVPWLVGQAHIAGLPLGRLEVLVARFRRWRFANASELEVELSDLVACGAGPAQVSELATAIAHYADGAADGPARLERALAALRGHVREPNRTS